MAKPAVVKDWLVLPGLALVGVAMLLVGSLATTLLRDSHVIDSGRGVAERWVEHLEHALEPGTLARSFRSQVADFDQAATVAHLGQANAILGFALHDANGDLFFAASRGNWLDTAPRATEWASLMVATEPDSTRSRLQYHSAAERMRAHVSVLTPFDNGGRRLGYIHTVVDRTELAASLTRSFRLIAGGTATSIILTIAIAVWLLRLKIMEQRRAQDRIRYLSRNDELTGLPNRTAFNERLSEALRLRQSDRNIAVAYIDISRFKHVNDALGHSLGDLVLQAFAGRLRDRARASDIVARNDGDEFAVALTGLVDAKEAAKLIFDLADVLRQPYDLTGEVLDISLRVGIAVAPSDGDDTATLLRHADLALVRAKKDGPNSIHFFERGMDTTFLRRREREKDLRLALEREEFLVLYQPQVWLRDGCVCGHEALVRWQHPVHGRISPSYFIGIAEDTEMILPLGEWILRRACRDAAAWPSTGRVAVNLSPTQFKHGSVADLVRGVVEESGLEPRRLEVEITENLLMWHTETVLRELTKLKDFGISIAMDDFGTGYSSLSYLSRFPFSKIKIDRSFVRAMHADETVSAIVSCIVGLGRSLNVTIMAEGVETREQARLLRSLDCEQAQGFLFGRPGSSARAAKRILETAPRTLSKTAGSAA